MQLALKCALVSTVLIAGMPVNAMAHEAPKTVEIEIDRSHSPARIYRRAERQAKRHCKVNRRELTTRWHRIQTCVQPILAEFVLGAKIEELLELHEKRTGRSL